MESILLEKGFLPKTNNTEKIFESTIKSTQSIFGARTFEAIVSHAQKNYNLQKNDLIKDYQIFSKVLSEVVGPKARETLIREITKRISFSTDWKYNDLNLEKIFDDISRKEMSEFLKNLTEFDHVLIIFKDQNSKNTTSINILKDVVSFGPSKIVFSKTKEKINDCETILLDSLLTSRNELVQNLINKINDQYLSNPSKHPTKIIFKDIEWWYEKGLMDEHQKLEREFRSVVKNSHTKLCMVSKEEIKEEYLHTLIDHHNYVVIEKPFKIFSKGQGFGNEVYANTIKR